MKKSKLSAIFVMAFIFFAFNLVGFGQTYTWLGADNAAWNDAANWNPTRITPSSTDVLQFNDGTTKTVTAVPTETVGQILLSNGTVINLQSAAAVTLTISGLAGTDLDIPAGCALNLDTVNAITINLPTGSTGSISGTITFSSTVSTAHRLTAADNSAITFNNGATFTAGTFFTGNAFGTTNLNSIVFASGSTYVAQAGSNPFGASQPSSVVVFQPGSLYKVNSNLTPSLSGRTYADLEINFVGAVLNSSGGAATSIDNLTITNGTLNFGMTGTPGHSIKGNISVAAGGILNFAPASAGTVNLNGTSIQTISNDGTLTFGANSTIAVNNNTFVSLSSPLTLNNLSLTNGIVNTGANTLNINGVITGGSITSYVDGKLAQVYNTAGSKDFPIGKGGNYRPLALNYISLDAPSTVTAEQSESALGGTLPANTTLFTDRFWTVTQSGATVFSYDITLDGTGFTPTATPVILKNDAGTISSLTTSETSPYYTATGLTSFSDFGLGDALPTIIAPTTQASNITFSSVTGSGLTTSWTNGDGSNRIVIINTSNSFSNPSDGTDPIADPVYTGAGEQIVFNGSESSVSVTGLSNNTIYWFRVYEYNGTASTTLFNATEEVGNPDSQATESVTTICGTKTVGVGGDYPTLSAAISDLNSKDLCGALNLTLTDDTYPDEIFPIIINNNAGSSSTNTITIKPAPGVSPSITCDTYPSLFVLNGSDYVILDGSNQVDGNSKDLILTNKYTGDTSNCVIRFVDNGTKAASNSTIINCIIKGTSTVTSSFGIYLNTDQDRYFENTSISNNTIKNARIGIQIIDAKNSIISANIIGDETEPLKQGGIEMSFCDSTLITGNEIFGEVAGNSAGYQYGISVRTNSTNTKISKNKIHDFYYTGSNGVACWGIKYSAGANTPTEISNNLIYNIKSDGDLVSGSNINWVPSGISIISGGNIQVYFNTINMTGNVLGTGPDNNFAGNSACFMINTAVTNMDVKNNIFKNSMTTIADTGTNKTYGVVSYSANISFDDINYNDYFIDGLNPNIGYLSGDMLTLPDWQAATSKDANSMATDPGFISDTDLHPSLSGPNNTGIGIPGITIDYANAIRSNPPDIGAYEYSILSTVVTDDASNITSNSADLNGTVIANYANTEVSFEWGLTTSYGNSIAATPANVIGVSATAVMASLTGLDANTTYHYRCVGVNEAGITYGDDQSFLTVNTGINDNIAVQNVSTYPNPSHGKFTLSITTSKKEVYNLRILNAMGIMVYERKAILVDGILKEVVGVPDLPLGVYTVVLYSANSKIIRKIVIN